MTTPAVPRNLTQAHKIAALGDAAVPVLVAPAKRCPQKQAIACVRALGLIGSEAAFEGLKTWREDPRPEVLLELIRAAASFDLDRYGPEILAHSPVTVLKPGGSALGSDPRILTYLTRLKVAWIPGYIELKDLALLSGMAGLEELSLHHSSLEALDFTGLEGLRSLTVSQASLHLEDLSPLSGLRRLEQLSLSAPVRSLEGLASLARLQVLSIWSEVLDDTRALGSLSGLQRLILGGLSAEALDLGGLSSLENAYIWRSPQIRALRCGQPLPRLRSLELRDLPALTDLSGLRALPALGELVAQGLPSLRDLSPLAGLHGLRSLRLLSAAALADVRPLASLAGLEKLDLSYDAAITDASPLGGLRGLRSLWLNGCTGLTDVSFLSGLVSLEELWLHQCAGIEDFGPLQGLTGLHTLYASGRVEGSALAGLAGLRRLGLSESDIRDLSFLAGLPALEELSLAPCPQVTDLSPLLAVPGLKKAWLHGTATAQEQVRQALRERGVQVYG